MVDHVKSSGSPPSPSLQRLRRVAELRPEVDPLLRRVPEMTAAVTAAIIADVAAFSDTANPKILPLLQRQVDELVTEYLRLLDGGVPGAPAFTGGYARETAEQYFPLEALLHAYRIGMRELLRITTRSLLRTDGADGIEVVSAATDFLLEFIDIASTQATEHYLDQSRLLADVASDQRSQLLSILLGGYDESDRRVSNVLRDSGYLDRRLRFCVVLAQSIDPAEMHNPGRARRLADSIDQLLAEVPGKRLVDLHRNKVTIVSAHRHRLSGWSSPDEPLSSRLTRVLLKLGPAARLGVSNDVESTAQIPAAYRQAGIAFDAASIGTRVVRFADIPLQRLLLGFAEEELDRVLPEWAEALRAADARQRGRWSQSLHAYADNDMNLLRTARALGVHANTLYARFDRIMALTGRDPRGFNALSELLIAAPRQT